MIKSMAPYTASPSAGTEENGSTASSRVGLSLGLCAVQAILAYEWLISGLNSRATIWMVGATLEGSTSWTTSDD